MPFLSITLHFGLIEVIDKREESWDDIKLQAEVASCRHLLNQCAQSIVDFAPLHKRT